MKTEGTILLENKISTTIQELNSITCAGYPMKVAIDFIIKDSIRDAYLLGIRYGNT